jgi:hypothetical protein
MPLLAGSNVIFRMFTEHLGGTQAADFKGNYGDIFYDPSSGMLMIADGNTPGGIPITGGGVANGADLSVNSITGSNDLILAIKAKNQPGTPNGAILSLAAGDSASGNSGGDVYITSGGSGAAGVSPGNVYISVGTATSPADYANSAIYIGAYHASEIRIGNILSNTNIALFGNVSFNNGPLANAIGVANTTALGTVSVDGVSILAAANGRISAINGTNTQSTFANLQVVDTATVANLSVGGDNLYANMSTFAILQAPYIRVGANTNSIVSGTGNITMNAVNIAMFGNVSINGSNQLYTLPIANTTALGGMKPDGVTTLVNASSGVLTINTVGITVANATSSLVGVVKPDNSSIFVDANGTIRAVTGNSAGTTFANITVTDTTLVNKVQAANIQNAIVSNTMIFQAFSNTQFPGTISVYEGAMIYGPINGGLYGKKLTIKGANATDYGGGTPSDVEIIGGADVSASVKGGSITLTSGFGSDSGDILLQTRYGSQNAGNINLVAGPSGDTGGSIALFAGSGAVAMGDVVIEGGIAANVVVPRKGGNVTLRGGNVTGLGTNYGDIAIGDAHTTNVQIGYANLNNMRLESGNNIDIVTSALGSGNDINLLAGSGSVQLASQSGDINITPAATRKIYLNGKTSYGPDSSLIFTTRYTPTAAGPGQNAILVVDHSAGIDNVWFNAGVNNVSPSIGQLFYTQFANMGLGSNIGYHQKFFVYFNQIGVTLATPLLWGPTFADGGTNGPLSTSIFWSGPAGRPTSAGRITVPIPNNAFTRFEIDIFRTGSGLNDFLCNIISTTMIQGL